MESLQTGYRNLSLKVILALMSIRDPLPMPLSVFANFFCLGINSCAQVP